MQSTIFIDLDDTLIDTSERQYRVFKDILYSNDSTAHILWKDEFWSQKRTGLPTISLLPKTSILISPNKFNFEWSTRIEQKRYLRYDQILPESLNVLSELKTEYKLILLTLRKNKKNLFWELEHFGLDKHFDEILLPTPLLGDKISLVKRYKQTNSEEINFNIIGDSEAEVNTGKMINIPIIAVTYGIRSRIFLEKLQPNFYASNLQEIPILLKRINNSNSTSK